MKNKAIKIKDKRFVHIKNTTTGITLIALIITIILMLILVGFVINLTIGENGLLTKAKQSGNIYNEQVAREKLEIVLLDMQADKTVNNTYNQNEYLTGKIEEQGMIVNDDIVEVEGWKFQIDRSVPEIIADLGKGELNKLIKEDDELAKLLKEANMTITVEDILNTPAITDELRGLIPEIKEGDVTKELNEEVITYKDHTGGMIRTSSEHSNSIFKAWKAFDRKEDTSALSANGSNFANNYYIEYEFVQEVYALQIKYEVSNGASDLGKRGIIIQGYDEQQNKWENVTQELTWEGNSNTKKKERVNLDFTKPYKRYRFYINSAPVVSANGHLISGLHEMQLYGVKTKPETNEELKQLLLLDASVEKITLNHMVTNQEFISRLINALSIETIKNNQILMQNLPTLIPEIKEGDVTKELNEEVITYKDHTGGMIRTSSEHSNSIFKAWKAFDRKEDTSALSANGSNFANNYYIEYEFVREVYAIQIEYEVSNGASDLGKRGIIIQGYDEQQNKWENVTQELTWEGNSNTKKKERVNLDFTKPYKRYRFYINSAPVVSANGHLISGLHEMQLYGKVVNI